MELVLAVGFFFFFRKVWISESWLVAEAKPWRLGEAEASQLQKPK